MPHYEKDVEICKEREKKVAINAMKKENKYLIV